MVEKGKSIKKMLQHDTIGGALGGMAAVKSVKNKTYYPCCNVDGNSRGCQYRYTCCKNTENSRGCQVYPVADIRYTCCGRGYGSVGCYKYYDCPNKAANDPTNSGCSVRRICVECDKTLVNQRGRQINRKVNDKSCSFIWLCCNKTGNCSEMQENDESLHCKTLCHGCSPYEKHVMKPINQKRIKSVFV